MAKKPLHKMKCPECKKWVAIKENGKFTRHGVVHNGTFCTQHVPCDGVPNPRGRIKDE